MPLVMEAVSGKRLQRSRSRPEVIVDAGGHSFLRCMPDRVAPLVTESSGHIHVAKLAMLKFLDGLLDRGRRTGLGAMLNYALVFFGRANQLPAFPEIVAAGLLDIHVLACLARPDGHQRVPLIRRGDRDRID